MNNKHRNHIKHLLPNDLYGVFQNLMNSHGIDIVDFEYSNDIDETFFESEYKIDFCTQTVRLYGINETFNMPFETKVVFVFTCKQLSSSDDLQITCNVAPVKHSFSYDRDYYGTLFLKLSEVILLLVELNNNFMFQLYCNAIINNSNKIFYSHTFKSSVSRHLSEMINVYIQKILSNEFECERNYIQTLNGLHDSVAVNIDNGPE